MKVKNLAQDFPTKPTYFAVVTGTWEIGIRVNKG